MNRESIVTIAFAGEAAGLRGAVRLHDLEGVETLAVVLVVVGERRCAPVATTAAGDWSPALWPLLRHATEALEAASRPSPPHADSEALAGVLAVLPAGYVAVVAEVRERDPSALEHGMAGLDGRLLQRRPARRSHEADAPAADGARGRAL